MMKSINRRTFTAAAVAAGSAALAAPPRSKMGVCTTSYMTYRKPRQVEEFLEYCSSLGAAGIQAPLPKDPATFRKRTEELGMFYEAMLPLPKNGDAEAFAANIRAAKAAGAACFRAGCLSGRRYETFADWSSWKRFVDESKAAIKTAVPVLDREKFPMALENHKDWITEEMLALLKEYSSEYFGVLVDTGNNISLLDEPYRLIEAFAPYAVSTHIKDMDYQESPDGFLMSEVPFGEGRLDMKRVIETIRAKRPATRFILEMITRNPLSVPCLTDKYWTTFPERRATDLARTLAMVRARKTKEPLPTFDHLPPIGQLKAEEDNVKQCLNYAREQLAL